MIDIALLQTFVRYLLIAVATSLASKGYYDNSLIEPLVGAGVAFFTILWFIVGKYLPEKKKNVDNNS